MAWYRRRAGYRQHWPLRFAATSRQHAPDVAGGQLSVAVDPHDDVASARPNRRVESCGSGARRIGHDADIIVLGGQLGGNRFGVVDAGCHRQADLHRAGIVLGSHGGDGSPQVGGLVAHRHHNGDVRPVVRHGRLLATDGWLPDGTFRQHPSVPATACHHNRRERTTQTVRTRICRSSTGDQLTRYWRS